jgi:glycerol-3-phosphate acyltransferase PlsY
MTNIENLALLFMLSFTTYLYGAIPFGYLVVRLFKGKDLTKEGTGNVGVINAWRAGGASGVLLTLLAEISKAFVAVGLAQHFFPEELYAKAVLILAAFVGTNWSVFLRWRGGRGTTMLIWSMGLLSLPVLLILIAIAALCAFLSRRRAGLRTLWSWFIPIVILLVERDWILGLFGFVVSILIFLKGRYSAHDAVYYVGNQRP